MRLLPALFALVFVAATPGVPGPVAAQDVTDTLFYDIRWQLCERTPAYYYRIGTMRIDSIARYVGPVEDYYINGQPEMKGRYALSGDLEGETVFYYPNGNIRMKGSFTKGKMTGQWFVYNRSGLLRAIFDCKSETNFTPLYLCNEKGKVLLEDGNGSFVLKTKDFEDFIFPSGAEIEGEVRNGQKDGTWEYSTSLSWGMSGGRAARVFASEQYVRGRFIRTVSNPYGDVDRRRVLEVPFSRISLMPRKFAALDRLDYDMVFERTAAGRNQLKSFLLGHRTPYIERGPVSADQNFSLFIRVICNGLMKREELAFKPHNVPGKTSTAYTYQMIPLGRNAEKSVRYHARIRFTILDSGNIGDLVIDGKIDELSRELITYYLLKLRGLYVSDDPAENSQELLLETADAGRTVYLPVIQLSRMEQAEVN